MPFYIYGFGKLEVSVSKFPSHQKDLVLVFWEERTNIHVFIFRTNFCRNWLKIWTTADFLSTSRTVVYTHLIVIHDVMQLLIGWNSPFYFTGFSALHVFSGSTCTGKQGKISFSCGGKVREFKIFTKKSRKKSGNFGSNRQKWVFFYHGKVRGFRIFTRKSRNSRGILGQSGKIISEK